MKAKFVIFFVVITFLIERISHNAISNFFARLTCGDNYLNTIDGRLSDSSCGFNADIQFVAIFFFILVLGLVISFLLKKLKKNPNH